MAINIPIITEFADAGLKSARGAFDTFKSKVAEAEGGMGKFKAGANVALDSVKANAGLFAAAAGGAIATFALKAIDDFKDLALEVDEFRNKTDLTLQQASQWVSYSSDLNIEADVITKIFSRVAKAATDEIPAFEELGVAIALGPDGATDVEATFLRVNDAINKLEDPVKQAAYRADLYGRGWMSAAEIIQMSSSDITTALQGVKDFEVIDEKEIEKAKNLREAQDELGDAFKEVSIKIGSVLIPALAAAAEFLTPIVNLVGDLDADTVKAASKEGGLVKYTKAWESLNSPLKWLVSPGGLSFLASDLMEVDEVVNDNYLSVSELEQAWETGTRQMIIAQDEIENTSDDIEDLDDAVFDLTDTFKDFLAEIDEEEAWNNLQEQLQMVKDKSFEAFVEGTAESAKEAQDETNELIRDIGKYIDELGYIPPDVQTEIVALLKRDKFDEALGLIEKLRQGVVVPITGTVSGIEVPAGQTPSETTGRGTVTAPISIPGLPFAIHDMPIRIPGIGAFSGGVTVNVAGSVISENDLVETVRKGLVNSQRNGAGLVYSNR
jgi:uncharacterized phage infection (PIP) family protein YhgE